MKLPGWSWLTGRDARRRRTEIDEELAAHLALRAQDNLTTGMTPERADADARERFGDAEETARACLRAQRRPARRVAFMASGVAAVGLVGAIVAGVVGAGVGIARADFARTAPYDGVRWASGHPEVRVHGTWYALHAIDGVSAGRLLEVARAEFGDKWKKRFEEDIVEVMDAAGRRPGDTVSLALQDLGTGVSIQLAGVEMTREKRQRIWREAHPGFAQLQPGESLTHQGGRGLPTLAPYDAIAWEGESPRVRVAGRWVELLALDGVSTADIVAFSKSVFPELRRNGAPQWQRRFEEDLVELLLRMERPPGPTVTLRVRDLATGREETLADVPMTGENRRAILHAAIDREDL